MEVLTVFIVDLKLGVFVADEGHETPSF